MANQYFNFNTDPAKAELDRAARQQKLADMLSSQGDEPIKQFSYNGIPAPISPLSGLAKILNAYSGAKAARDTAEESKRAQAKSAADEGADYNDLVRAMTNKGTPAVAATPLTMAPQGAGDATDGQPYDLQNTDISSGFQGGARPAVAATPGGIESMDPTRLRTNAGREYYLNRQQDLADNLLKAKQLAEQHADDAAARLVVAQQTNDTKETIARLAAEAAAARAELNSITQQLLQGARGDTAVKVANIGGDTRLGAANIVADASRFSTNQRRDAATDQNALVRQQAPLKLQNNLDVANANAGGRERVATIGAKANMYGTDARAAAAQATDATNRWLPPLRFQNNLDVQTLRNEGGVAQANIRAVASQYGADAAHVDRQDAAARVQGGRDETARHNAATEYLAAVEVWNKTGEWHGPPGTPPPAGVAGSPERAAAMQQAQVPLITRELDEQGKVAAASARAWKDLEQIKSLSAAAPEGSLAAAQLGLGNFFASFGFKLDPKAQNAGTVMQSAITDILRSQMQALGARGLTDRDMQVLKDNLPKLGQSADARVAVANVLQKAEYNTMSEYNNSLTGYKEQIPGLVRVDPLWLKEFTAGKFNSPDAGPAVDPRATPAAAAAAKNRQAIFDAADDVLGGR